TWIDIPFNRHDVADFQIMSPCRFGANNTGIPLFFESLDLILWNNELRINVKICLGINRKSWKRILEIIRIFVDPLKPIRECDVFDSRDSFDFLLIHFWQLEND